MDYAAAASSILGWLAQREEIPSLDQMDCVGVRVVHGGERFTRPIELTDAVAREILDLGKWAPLHDKRSVEILPPIRRQLPHIPVYAALDTAFHCTIPEFARLYPIPPASPKSTGFAGTASTGSRTGTCSNVTLRSIISRVKT